MPWLSRPPALPRHVEGFLYLSGTAVPVVPLDVLLSLEPDPIDAFSTLIVLRADPPCALRVHRAKDLLTVSDGAIEAIGKEHSLNGCAEGALQWEGGTIALLSPERLLLEEEKARLRDLRVQEEQRLALLRESSQA